MRIVSLAAVFSIVTQRSSLRDDTKNGCEGDYHAHCLEVNFISCLAKLFQQMSNFDDGQEPITRSCDGLRK